MKVEDKNHTGWRKWLQEYDEKLFTIKDDQTFYVHGYYIQFSKLSLGMLDNKSKLRIFMVWLVKAKWFEHFITSLILINSVFLGIKDYTDKNDETPINQFVENSEIIFKIFFFIECITKVIAMGFIIGKKSYLSDAWNWIDFAVVISSLLTSLPSMKSVSGLRTFRLFRPLRSL